MLTSTAVVMTLLCNFAAGLMGSTLNTYIPTYFKDALYVNLLSVSALNVSVVSDTVCKYFFTEWIVQFFAFYCTMHLESPIRHDS